MNIDLKVHLKDKIQEWLNENADEIGDKEGIFQDATTSERTANIMTNAVEAVIDGMRHQEELRIQLS